MSLYQTIFKRRSVRKYNKQALSAEIIEDIRAKLKSLQELQGQRATFRVVDCDAIANAKAPHYILAFCNSNDIAYMNVGFCLQEMDLYIQSKGLGSLWLGTTTLKGEEDSEDYCIRLAFGSSDAEFRKDTCEFKRLAIEQISNIDNEISQAVRLAPSAWNSQPWQLEFASNSVVIKYVGRGLLKGLLKKRLSKIDMGIAAKHAELALTYAGKKITAIDAMSKGSNLSIRISYSD